ncbi:hypothetical protein ACFQ3R_03205 [Mesonia ostreae]|uniref:Uncharacterized protein n=1 Tax=Mesonia ostreae TaxID=861110 RepID=A0ABU2KKP3_9FLAO|nr:hypothetical protein [Mesonia ostreae]MDT0295244.1 hypothetical protein [Mesonia ostreae]
MNSKSKFLKSLILVSVLFFIISCSSDDEHQDQDYPEGYILNYNAKLSNTEDVYEVSFLDDDNPEENSILHEFEVDGIEPDSMIGAGTFFDIENNSVGVKFRVLSGDISLSAFQIEVKENNLDGGNVLGVYQEELDSISIPNGSSAYSSIKILFNTETKSFTKNLE